MVAQHPARDRLALDPAHDDARAPSDSPRHSGSGTGTPPAQAARSTSHSRRRPAGSSPPPDRAAARTAGPVAAGQVEGPQLAGGAARERRQVLDADRGPEVVPHQAASSARRFAGSVKMRGRVVTSEGGANVDERWFSDEELRELSRPTMDRAIEAIDAGDLERGARCARR